MTGPAAGPGSASGSSDMTATANASQHHLQLLQRFFSRDGKHEIVPSSTLEWCLEQVFEKFVALTENKLEVILNQSMDREIDLHGYLQAGIHADFDACITTLGALSKHAPALIVNSLMYWRDTACDLPESVPPTPTQTTSIRGSLRGKAVDPTRDLRLIASNIMFCRALIEVIRGVGKGRFPDDLFTKCEELAFLQLKASSPDLIRSSVNWQANATNFARVLGELSDLRFASVTDRYLRELERLAGMNLIKDGKVEHLIFGLRFVKIKIYPMDALEETADFLDSLGHFFLNSVDTLVRQAFMEVFLELLQPLCDVITAEVNVPTWSGFVESAFPKVQKMALRPRHQTVAFALLTCLLNASRTDFFHKNWLAVSDMCNNKFKDRTMRADALLCLSQLMWTYLFRYSEPTSTAHKRILMLIKVVFPSGRRSINPLEVPLSLFIHMVYMLAMRFTPWTVKNVLSYLLLCDGSIESTWSPDRMTIAIETLHLLMDAWSTNAHACPYPTMAGLPRPSRPPSDIKPKHLEYLTQLGTQLHRILDGLHQYVGQYRLDDERNKQVTQIRSVSAATDTSDLEAEYSPASFIATIPRDRIPFLELLKTLVAGVPRLVPGYESDRLVDVLCSYAAHYDSELSSLAMDALLRMAETNPVVYQDVLVTLEKSLFADTDRQQDLLATFYVRADETAQEQRHRGTLEIYLDFLKRGKQHTRQLPLDAIGLYLLCSPHAHIRRLALDLLEQADSMVVTILRQTNLFHAASSAQRKHVELWASRFSDFISYCVDFMSRDAIKRAVQAAWDRALFLQSILAPPDTGLLWTTAVRSPPEESILNWRRCAKLAVLGVRYLSAPREVMSTSLALLSSEFTHVREAALAVLAQTAVTHQALLFDEMVPLLSNVAEDARQRAGKRFSQPKKPGKIDRLRVELPRLLASLPSFPSSTLPAITAFIKAYRSLLADQRSNVDLEAVRTAFSQFIDHFYSSDAEKSLDLRPGLFQMLSEWDEPVAMHAMAALLRGPVPSPGAPTLSHTHHASAGSGASLGMQSLGMQSVAMMAMLNPPSFHSTSVPQLPESFDFVRVLRWIRPLLAETDMVPVAKRALVNLLEANLTVPALFETIVAECFALDPSERVAQHFFVAVATVFVDQAHGMWTATSLETVLLLALMKIVDDDEAVRSCAVNLLLVFQDRLFLDLHVETVTTLTEQPIQAKWTHVTLVERLMQNHAEWTYSMLSELFMRLKSSHERLHGDLLLLASRMAANVVLVSDSSFISSESRFVVDNLLYYTFDHWERHASIIRQCWANLVAGTPDNLSSVIGYFVQVARSTRSDRAVTFFQVILALLLDSHAVFACLLPYLNPGAFIAAAAPPLAALSTKFHSPSLQEKVRQERDRPPWSEGIIATMCLSGLATRLAPATIEQHLALFLQIILAQVSHPDPFVTDQMRRFLDTLFQFQFAWTSASDELECVVAAVLDVLPEHVVEAWNALALEWAGTSTIRHVAMRSLRMFRATLRSPRPAHLASLVRLYPAAVESSAPYALEILTSLNTVVAKLPTAQLGLEHVAVLQCVVRALAAPATPATHGPVLLEILGLLLATPNNVECALLADWGVPMPSVTHLLVHRVQTTGDAQALDLINRLIDVNEGFTWKPLLVLLANLPRIVHPPYSAEIDDVCVRLAAQLATLAPAMSKYLAAWAKYHAKSGDDLVVQLGTLLKGTTGLFAVEDYVPVLFQFLASPDAAAVEAHLMLLKALLPLVKFDDTLVSHAHLAQVMDLTKVPQFSTLALAMLDHLVESTPKPNQVDMDQAVLPSRSCTINKKSPTTKTMMQEWMSAGSSMTARSGTVGPARQVSPMSLSRRLADGPATMSVPAVGGGGGGGTSSNASLLTTVLDESTVASDRAPSRGVSTSSSGAVEAGSNGGDTLADLPTPVGTPPVVSSMPALEVTNEEGMLSAGRSEDSLGELVSVPRSTVTDDARGANAPAVVQCDVTVLSSLDSIAGPAPVMDLPTVGVSTSSSASADSLTSSGEDGVGGGGGGLTTSNSHGVLAIPSITSMNVTSEYDSDEESSLAGSDASGSDKDSSGDEDDQQRRGSVLPQVTRIGGGRSSSVSSEGAPVAAKPVAAEAWKSSAIVPAVRRVASQHESNESLDSLSLEGTPVQDLELVTTSELDYD
ncbi:Cell morphogenesis protein PAG1 [Allomyces javanicus]|nr:Cell morphogenesis protein PAG1 [Allomyces javanicus]